VVVCLLAANHESSCSLTQAVDGCIVCCGIISSCQSAATSDIVKTLLVLSSSYVRSHYSKYGTLLYLVELSYLVFCLEAGLWQMFSYQLLLSSASLFRSNRVQTSIVFVCDVAVHLLVLSFFCCFAQQYPAIHYIPQNRVEQKTRIGLNLSVYFSGFLVVFKGGFTQKIVQGFFCVSVPPPFVFLKTENIFMSSILWRVTVLICLCFCLSVLFFGFYFLVFLRVFIVL